MGEGVGPESLEIAASAISGMSAPASFNDSPDSAMIRDAVEKAREMLTERAQRNAARPSNTLKFSAPMAVKAAEICKTVAPIDDPTFPELFQLS